MNDALREITNYGINFLQTSKIIIFDIFVSEENISLI